MKQCIPALYSLIVCFSCSTIPSFTYSLIQPSFDEPLTKKNHEININRITKDGFKRKNFCIYSHWLFEGLGTISVFLFVALKYPAFFLDSANLPPYSIQRKREKREETLGNLLSLKVLLLIRLPILFSAAGSQTQMSSSTFHGQKRCSTGDCLWVCDRKNDRVGQDSTESLGVTGGTCLVLSL